MTATNLTLLPLCQLCYQCAFDELDNLSAYWSKAQTKSMDFNCMASKAFINLLLLATELFCLMPGMMETWRRIWHIKVKKRLVMKIQQKRQRARLKFHIVTKFNIKYRQKMTADLWIHFQSIWSLNVQSCRNKMLSCLKIIRSKLIYKTEYEKRMNF